VVEAIEKCEDAGRECFRVANKVFEMDFLALHRQCFDFHGLNLEGPGNAYQ
jgi:hypothetical protein